jgi:hypothetical protein
MSDTGRHETDAALDEIEELEQKAVTLLRAERPFPSPNFRGELRRRLLGAGRSERRPGLVGSLSAQIAGCLSVGVILMGVAAAGLIGAGPFAS